jgi:hypothetical protein
VQRWLSPEIERVGRALHDKPTLKAINAGLDGWGSIRGLATVAPSSLRLMVRSPFPGRLGEFCRECGLKYLHRKTGEKSFAFAFTDDSLKKKIVESLSCETDGDGVTTVDMTVGRKFDPRAFLASSFCLPSPDERVRITARADGAPSG